MALKQIQDADVKDKKVLVRVDYNVPLESGQVQDNARIRESVDTIKYLLENGASKVIILSHLGRPVGNVVDEMRLAPVVQALSQLIGDEVDYLENTLDEVTPELINTTINRVVCLENVRFDSREEAGDDSLAKHLAKLGDMFVLDGFSVAHREHATVTKIAQHLPAYAGIGFMREKRQIDDFMQNIKRPFWGIFGGIKLSDKIPVIKSLQDLDGIMAGSSIAMAVLQRYGFDVGASMVAKDSHAAVDELVEMIKTNQLKVVFPQDLLVGSTNEDKVIKVLDINIDEVITGGATPFSLCEPDEAIYDIGEKTIDNFTNILDKAGAVFWNGPLGLAEKEVFANGTRLVAEKLAKIGAVRMAGGGDTVAVLKDMNLLHEYDYVSTSGGAMMEYIANGTLPGIEALKENKN